MSLWVRLGWRQMRSSRTFISIYIFNLALGLCGFLALDLYHASFEAFFANRARAILTADLAVASRRPLTDDERGFIKAPLQGHASSHDQMRLLSMIASPTRSRLASVVASSAEFPFFGEFRFSDGKKRERSQELNDAPILWIYPELAADLQVKPGQSVRIGDKEFRVEAIIQDDPTGSSGAFEFAPRVYIGMAYIQATGLLQKGSRIEYRTYIKNIDPQAPGSLTKESLQKILTAADVSVLTPSDAVRQLGRAFNYLTDYLSLIALIGLFIVGIANTFLFRGFIKERQSDIGLMRIVGATGREAQGLFLWQVLFLGVGAGCVAILSATALTYGIHRSVVDLLPKEFVYSIPWRRLPALLTGALFVGFLASLPNIRSAGLIRPLILLNPSPISDIQRPSLIWFFPALIGFLLLAMAAANSVKVGGIFFFGLAAVAVLALGIGLVYGILLRQIGLRHLSLPIKLAIRNAVRSPATALAGFVTMVIVTCLLTLVPQLKHLVLADLEDSDQTQTPSLFLFDIQPEQVELLTSAFQKHDIVLDAPSPMVTARLTAINGKLNERPETSANATREEEEARSTKTRTYNLSYRQALGSSETVTAGVFNPPRKDSDPPAISVEERFAERLGVRLGDTLSFDIQGVPVTGQITALRRVKWRSFAPNFFIQFQPGPLDEAPRTYVAAVRSPSDQSKEKAQEILANDFANVSVVDVSRTIGRIEGIIDQIARVIGFVAIICAIGGGFVLFALANYQASLRGWEFNLMRILGTSLRTMTASLAFEFLFISGLGTFFGTGFGIGLLWMLNHFIFDAPFVLDGKALIIVLTTILLLIQGIGIIAFWRRLMDEPAYILRESV